MIWLHIGTHKTGSKSLQQWLADHRARLLADNTAFYIGHHTNPNNHSELGLAALREGRDSFARIRFPALAGQHYRDSVAEQLNRYLDSTSARTVIFSNEDLSLLRFPDELAALKRMFGNRKVQILLCLRNRTDFLRSYREQIRRVPGRHPTKLPSSCLYAESDSWLADYQALVESYSSAFGRTNLTVVNYDSSVAKDRSVLPAMLSALGISAFPHDLHQPQYFRNKSLSQLRTHMPF